jgi:hypothetical protein
MGFMFALKTSCAISHVNSEFKTNISGIFSNSIIVIDAVYVYISMIFIYLYIHQSAKAMPRPIGVLYRRVVSSCVVTHPARTYHYVA